MALQQLVSVNKKKYLTGLCAAMLWASSLAQVTDPLAFDYSNHEAVNARSDEHIQAFTSKAVIATRIKDSESIKLYLLDPASIEEQPEVLHHVSITDPEAVNQLKLGLLEVLEAKQDAPFCFYPNYKIIGHKGSEQVFEILLSAGCGVYKAHAGTHQISDGFRDSKLLKGALNSILPIRPGDQDVEKVVEENARRLLKKMKTSAEPIPTASPPPTP